MNILIATEKPFAPIAVQGIQDILQTAGHSVTLLERYDTPAALREAASSAEAMIIRSDIIDEQLLAAATQLKIIVRAGAGVDNVDLAAASARGIVVMNTPGQNANAVAELVIGLMIFAARQRFTPGIGAELRGKRLGIVAFGNIGRLVAHLGLGLGMQVQGFNGYKVKAMDAVPGVKSILTIEEIFATSDYLSLHLPATETTRRMINLPLLLSTPKGAVIVNTARKEIIHEEDLVTALAQRPDLRYYTDIQPDNHALLSATYPTQYFATPKKMGAQTAEANINAGLAAAQQIVRFVATGDKTFQVNPS